MYRYKLIQRVNPANRDAGTKWYATPMSETAVSQKIMAREATDNTTVSPKEMETALELLGNYAIKELQKGHVIRVGDLGTLRVTFRSEGAETIDGFNALSMIKDKRIVFTPSKEFRAAVLTTLQFQNSGVKEGNVNYASIADYKEAKGLTTSTTPTGSGGGTSSGGSSGSGDQGGDPLGD